MTARTAKPPLFFEEPQDDREFTRKVSLIVRELLDGKINSVYEVTLEPDSETTRVVADRASIFSVALLSPKSASAAAALSSLWYETTKGEVTLHHGSSPETDRRFGLVLLG